MEEVEQLSSEEEIEVPSPPKLERHPPEKQKMTDKVQCEQCSKWLSRHCWTYSHKCKARAPDEKVEKVEKTVAKKATFDKEALSKALKAPPIPRA